VTNSFGVSGDPLDVQCEVFNYDDNIEVDTPVLDFVINGTAGSVTTSFTLDLSSLTEDARYLIRVRALEAGATSNWESCNFWIDLVNQPPSEVQIVSPENDAELPAATTSVLIEVSAIEDLDPGDAGLFLAFCEEETDLANCPADVTTWPQVPQADGTITSFSIDGLFPGDERFVQVCALDDRGACGEADTVHFTVSEDDIDPAPANEGCGCAARDASPLGCLFLLALFRSMRRRRWTSDGCAQVP